jgi:hypothetical protein
MAEISDSVALFFLRDVFILQFLPGRINTKALKNRKYVTSV